LYFNTTDSDVNNSGGDGTSRTYNINLSTNVVRLFASPQTIDLATNQPVGGGFRNADNLAIDAEGNIYIVEDRGGGSDDDIWFAVDLNRTVTCSTREKAWHDGHRTERRDPSSPGCTSTSARPTGRSSIFSIPRVRSTG
jgi:hypothetical protein